MFICFDRNKIGLNLSVMDVPIGTLWGPRMLNKSHFTFILEVFIKRGSDWEVNRWSEKCWRSKPERIPFITPAFIVLFRFFSYKPITSSSVTWDKHTSVLEAPSIPKLPHKTSFKRFFENPPTYPSTCWPWQHQATLLKARNCEWMQLAPSSSLRGYSQSNLGSGEGKNVLTLVSFTNNRGYGIDPWHQRCEKSCF